MIYRKYDPPKWICPECGSEDLPTIIVTLTGYGDLDSDVFIPVGNEVEFKVVSVENVDIVEIQGECPNCSKVYDGTLVDDNRIILQMHHSELPWRD